MLTTQEVTQLNDFQGFLNFKITWPYKTFLKCSQKILLLIYGNQGGKTGGTAHSYVLRILGQHPIAKRNVLYYECKNDHAVAPYKLPEDSKCECGEELKPHERGSKVFRFCSQTLPGQTGNMGVEGGTSEVKNTQYPEFKKWLPHFLVKKDITVRNPAMVVKDPFGGKDIIVEFVSYNQSVQSTAGTQRMSCWFDESPDFDFYEEQLPRLLAEDGDMVFTYTPVDRSSWLFDEFYEKAQVYHRSDYIIDYLEGKGEKALKYQETESPFSIAVVMAATDDNPTLDSKVIDTMYYHMDDPDAIAIRRYGIFKQLSGRIFKDFDYGIHVIKKKDYFDDELPQNWTFVRGIDYHPQTPWACGMMAISPRNEAFIFGEQSLSPEKFTTKEICTILAEDFPDQKFKLSLVDPLSETIKKDNISILDDINTEFRLLRKLGKGTGGRWQTWDTRSERGRDAIRQRLKNSLKVEKPFSNQYDENGITKYLPTIWVFNTCKVTMQHMKNWRWEEWADLKSSITKEEKNKPEQKWSHMNMVWEGLFKSPACRPPSMLPMEDSRHADYFRRSR